MDTVALGVLAAVAAGVPGGLELVNQVGLAGLVVAAGKEQTQAALAAQQSSASTTKEQPCTTHLLNPTL